MLENFKSAWKILNHNKTRRTSQENGKTEWDKLLAITISEGATDSLRELKIIVVCVIGALVLWALYEYLLA